MNLVPTGVCKRADPSFLSPLILVLLESKSKVQKPDPKLLHGDLVRVRGSLQHTTIVQYPPFKRETVKRLDAYKPTFWLVWTP